MYIYIFFINFKIIFWKNFKKTIFNNLKYTNCFYLLDINKIYYINEKR